MANMTGNALKYKIKSDLQNGNNEAVKYDVKTGLANGTLVPSSSGTSVNQPSAPDYSSYARQNSGRASAKEALLLGATEGREMTQPTITAPVTINGESGGSTGGSSSSNGGGYTAPINNAYDDLQSYLDSIYAAQEAQRQREYQNTLGQLRSARDQGANALNQNADNALRQAYVNYMMGRRNVNQALSNAGLTGGATESTIADLYNNYGDNRAAIERERMNGLSNLDLTYNQGVADAGMAYGSDYTDLLTNYMQNMYGLRENYANDLAKALSNANAQRYSGGNSGSNEGSEGGNANVDYQNLVSQIGRNLNADMVQNSAPVNPVSQTPVIPSNFNTQADASSSDVVALFNQMKNTGKSNAEMKSMLAEAYQSGLVPFNVYTNLMKTVR